MLHRLNVTGTSASEMPAKKIKPTLAKPCPYWLVVNQLDAAVLSFVGVDACRTVYAQILKIFFCFEASSQN